MAFGGISSIFVSKCQICFYNLLIYIYNMQQGVQVACLQQDDAVTQSYDATRRMRFDTDRSGKLVGSEAGLV